jgi:peptide/nickel transport system permease protein
MAVALFGVSVPSFWLGLMLIFLFSLTLGWLPVTEGAGWQRLVMPAVTLGLYSTAVISRLTRSSMLEVLHQEYVTTARAKGLRERVVVGKHALANALIPVVTIVGVELGTLLSGAVLTEQIFSIPGFGKLIVDAVFNRDYAVVQGVVLVTATAYVVLSLLADLAYFAVNPRLRG